MYNLNNIKKLATDKNVSLIKIIQQCGISEGGFYRSIENNSMNIKTVAKIAEILKVSISELVGEKSEPVRLTKNTVASPIEIYEPPTELSKCYKIMYEQQVEITQLTKELEGLKNGYAPANGANVG